jgi:hypothetical protein
MGFSLTCGLFPQLLDACACGKGYPCRHRLRDLVRLRDRCDQRNWHIRLRRAAQRCAIRLYRNDLDWGGRAELECSARIVSPFGATLAEAPFIATQYSRSAYLRQNFARVRCSHNPHSVQNHFLQTTKSSPSPHTWPFQTVEPNRSGSWRKRLLVWPIPHCT